MRFDRLVAVAAVALLLAVPVAAQTVIINEVDSDTPTLPVNDALEFVELYDGGVGNTSLNGLVVVFFNGATDTSYVAYDLDGYSTNASGYFLLGNSGVTPAPGVVFPANTLQNGADAVALYLANAADFPAGTAVTTSNLVDALVYDTNDADDSGLLPLLNAGQPQVDENGGAGGSANDSNQRCLNGQGGARNTAAYVQTSPTPGAANACGVASELSIDDVTHAEGNAGTTTFTFTVSLSAPAPPGGVSFDIATADDTATAADNDYVARSLTGQTIAEGQQTYTFDVTVNGDTNVELDERFYVNVSNVSGIAVTVGDGQGVGTIAGDDGVKVSIDDVTLAEGDAGTTTFSFTVSLSQPAKTGGVSFDIATADGSATTADSDYVGNSLPIQTIAAGSSSYTFDVTVNGDDVFEPDETFLVQVSNVGGTDAYLGDGEGTGTITNDDSAPLVINEIDYDQTGTDTAEFIELYNRDSASLDLGEYSLVLVNGTAGGAAVYGTIDLPAVSLAAGDYFVVCSNAAKVPNCDLDVTPNTDLVQNGAPDAVALVRGANLVDTVSYEGDTGAPYTEGSGTGLSDDASAYTGIARYPDGTDTNVNNADLALHCITPGMPNASGTSSCPSPFRYNVMINEVDSDTTSTDTAEFIELYDGGMGNVPLDGLVVVLYNGSNDLSYAAYDLDTYSTDPNGYFLLGNAGVSPAPGLVFADNSLQNGADAVALYRADAASFPNGTAITTANLQDAIVYDTADADDTGLLVLLNAGQPQVDENGGGNSAGHSNQRCPSGYGGLRNTTSYLQMEPSPGTTGTCVYEIFEIQGNGMASPFAGFAVTTNNNIVTAVGPEGFFIQTPDGRADADPETSNGIYVYAGFDLGVAVGDRVDVSGWVQEYYDFTEIAGPPGLTIYSSGNTLPAAIALDAATPSPNQPQPANAYERYEGMLVSIANGIVSGPTQYFGSDPTAEAFIVASAARPFREPGLLYPGDPGYPLVPIWDGNPEVFELDSDKLVPALDPDLIPAGSTFSAEGVLAYEFGGYELWSTSLMLNPAALPVPVRSRATGELTVGSLNTYRLFDNVNDPGSADDGSVESFDDYQRHLYKLAWYVADVLGAPDILGVQEVEHLGALQDLAQVILSERGVSYTAYLEEGNDVGGIDVGFLVRTDTIADEVVTQLGKDELLSVDSSLLHDRPPLLLEANYVGNGVPFPVKVLVVHQRSLNDIETSERVRQKRLEQAQSVAQMVQDLLDIDPGVRLVVVGDFNAYEVTDGYVDVVGQIKGDVDPTQSMLSGPDLVDPNLYDEVLGMPAGQRYSYIYDGTAQVLDHALTSQGIAPFVRGMQYGRGNADAPEYLELDDFTPQRCSDHDGLVLFLMSDFNGDGVPDDAPQFLLLGNLPGIANGTVTDASGIVSLILGPGSANASLGTIGNPGGTTWSWTVTLVEPTLPGVAELIATDADGRTATLVIALQASAPVPVNSPAALALLALLLAAAAVVALRRMG